VNGTVFPYYYGIDKLTGINKEDFGEVIGLTRLCMCKLQVCRWAVPRGRCYYRPLLVSEMTEGMRFLVILRLVGISVTLGLKGNFVISEGMLVSGGTVGVERKGVQGATSREVCVGT
jgi:hypothetical protein